MGANEYDLLKSHIDAYTRKDGTVVAAHEDKRTALSNIPAKGGSAKKESKPIHHSDLKEGDQLIGPDGEKHEYSHTKRGLGRMQIETRAGHSFPTEKDGSLPGWKKTGTNFAKSEH